ncbi:hypothetical protein IG631_20722 [Alternaria alternata]|nr:hypothetical protein IG631_20722 [Alternaria alternata]
MYFHDLLGQLYPVWQKIYRSPFAPQYAIASSVGSVNRYVGFDTVHQIMSPLCSTLTHLRAGVDAMIYKSASLLQGRSNDRCDIHLIKAIQIVFAAWSN